MPSRSKWSSVLLPRAVKLYKFITDKEDPIQSVKTVVLLSEFSRFRKALIGLLSSQILT